MRNPEVPFIMFQLRLSFWGVPKGFTKKMQDRWPSFIRLGVADVGQIGRQSSSPGPTTAEYDKAAAEKYKAEIEKRTEALVREAGIRWWMEGIGMSGHNYLDHNVALKSRVLTNAVQSHVSSVSDGCTVLGLERFGNENPFHNPDVRWSLS